MLKIKDNVDLKELETYEFYENDKGEWEYTDYDSDEIIRVQKNRYIYIETIPRYYGSIVEDLLSKLFDLIQAGLVEKVSYTNGQNE